MMRDNSNKLCKFDKDSAKCDLVPNAPAVYYNSYDATTGKHWIIDTSYYSFASNEDGSFSKLDNSLKF